VRSLIIYFYKAFWFGARVQDVPVFPYFPPKLVLYETRAFAGRPEPFSPWHAPQL
jgi:hypothetical protein